MSEGEYLPLVTFRRARPQDASLLASVSRRAFDNDVHYGAAGPGGPPGYDSATWQQRMMRHGEYYVIERDGEVIGGLIVFRKEPRCYELGRIFVDPDLQNQGIGSEAFQFLWKTYPLAKRWSLGTPQWNKRTRHFYSKVGFTEVGLDGHGGVLFERWIPARGTGPSGRDTSLNGTGPAGPGRVAGRSDV
jgi:RimJ/RimL family protein N-acetyltransferase